MDLAIGAKHTFVMMSLLTRDGRSKLVPECTMPLTGVGCVSRVYTDHGVFLLEPQGVAVRELFGIAFSDLQELVEVPPHRQDGHLMALTRTQVSIVVGGPAA